MRNFDPFNNLNILIKTWVIYFIVGGRLIISPSFCIKKALKRIKIPFSLSSFIILNLTKYFDCSWAELISLFSCVKLSYWGLFNKENSYHILRPQCNSSSKRDNKKTHPSWRIYSLYDSLTNGFFKLSNCFQLNMNVQLTLSNSPWKSN